MAKLESAPLIGGMSGQLGNVVLVSQPSGTVMRERVIPRNPRSAAQHAWRTAIKRAGEAYRSLTLEQYQAWEQYCQSIAKPGERMVPVVQVFMRLGAKAWQVGDFGDASEHKGHQEPTLTPAHEASPTLSLGKGEGSLGLVPLWPPTVPFGGDSLVVSVSAVPGGVRFTASGPNAEGVVTELLLQRTTSLFAASYDAHYRCKGFVTFDEPTADVAVPPGFYACAIRFVKMATGEQTAIMRLGTVKV